MQLSCCNVELLPIILKFKDNSFHVGFVVYLNRFSQDLCFQLKSFYQSLLYLLKSLMS